MESGRHHGPVMEGKMGGKFAWPRLTRGRALVVVPALCYVIVNAFRAGRGRLHHPVERQRERAPGDRHDRAGLHFVAAVGAHG